MCPHCRVESAVSSLRRTVIVDSESDAGLFDIPLSTETRVLPIVCMGKGTFDYIFKFRHLDLDINRLDLH